MLRSLAAALCCLLGVSAAAQTPDSNVAVIGGHTYVIPRAGLNGIAYIKPGERLTQIVGFDVRWPGMALTQSSRAFGYEQGLVAVSLQDISPSTRVEHLRDHPGERAKFLTLWRDSTVDQSSLADDFALSDIAPMPTERARALGLLEVPLRPRDLTYHRNVMYADGPLAALYVLMTCDEESGCQLWWMQDSAAVEVTFNVRFRPEWQAIKSAVEGSLRTMRAD